MHEELQAILTTLAANFGTSIESLWTILIRQVYIDAVTGFFPAVILGLMTFGLWWWSRRLVKERDRLHEENPNRYYDDEPIFFFRIAAIVGGLITSIALAVAVSGLMVALLNPEWAALQMILGKLP